MMARSRARRWATGAVLAAVLIAPHAHGQKTDATNGLVKCQQAVSKEGAKLAKEMEKRLGDCLQSVAGQVVKLGLEGDPAAPAAKCAKALRKLHDSRGLGKSAEEKARAKIAKRCEPAGAAFTLADLLGPGAAVDEPLAAANLDGWCAEYGGDGTLDDLDDWLDCLVAATRCRSGQVVVARYPRALEWLAEVRTAIAALPAGGDPAAVQDALDGLDAVVAMVDPNGDQHPDARCVGPGLCPPGRFSVDGQTPCAECPLGTFASVPGAAACADCAAGSFASTPGATTCTDCGPGTFQEVAGQGACQPCPPGTFSDSAETTTCTPCPPGRFSDAAGATSCQQCEPGRFQDESGETTCEACPPGTFTPATESTGCVPCAPGTFQPSAAATQCTDCSAGTFNADFGRASCADCPPGRFADVAGATTCALCDVGQFQDTPGQIACLECPADSYAPAVGQAECFPCAGAPPGASTCSCTFPP